MNHALPSESYIARLDYLAFNGKVCSSVEYSDEQRFLEDLKESLYHGEPLCVVLYRDQNGKTISRAFLNDLDIAPENTIPCESAMASGAGSLRALAADRRWTISSR